MEMVDEMPAVVEIFKKNEQADKGFISCVNKETG
jgi:hypothetical protein